MTADAPTVAAQRFSLSGTLLVLISAASFGAIGIFARIAFADGVDTTTLLFLRFAVAAAGMNILQRARGERWARGSGLRQLALLGGIGYVAQSICYFGALNYAPAGVVSLLLYLFPAIVAVLAAVVLNEPLTAPRVIALLLALSGCALTIEIGGGADPRGVVLALSAAFIYAIYVVAGRNVTAREGSVRSTTVIITAAAVVFTIVAAVRGVHLPRSATGWLAVIAIALVSTILAIVTFFAGLARVGATGASMLSTFEPVVAMVLASIALDETPTLRQLEGGALILVAVLLLTASDAWRGRRIEN